MNERHLLAAKRGHGRKVAFNYRISYWWSVDRLSIDRNLIIKAVALLWCLLIVVDHCMAADFKGEVIGVLDGDTIEVLHERKPERIRLYGIDCPEKGQAFGQKAKQPLPRSSSARK
jgi:endonuclease YncB( thermonuclease family)